MRVAIWIVGAALVAVTGYGLLRPRLDHIEALPPARSLGELLDAVRDACAQVSNGAWADPHVIARAFAGDVRLLDRRTCDFVAIQLAQAIESHGAETVPTAPTQSFGALTLTTEAAHGVRVRL